MAVGQLNQPPEIGCQLRSVGQIRKEAAEATPLFFIVKIVRRHIKWNIQRPDLREDLAHLVQDVMRRVCGIASAGSPWFLV